MVEKVTTGPNGTRTIHIYGEMTPAKRPQDLNMDGSGLRFKTLEHHGLDLCPEAIRLTNEEGRSCIYLAEAEFAEGAERPQDTHMDGRTLRFTTLEHGADYPDRMPRLLRVTDAERRTCYYRPVMEDDKVVDSKGFHLEPAEAD
jgi:hypothetical protein